MFSGLRVLVVEDEAVFATALADSISAAEGEVVGPFASAAEARSLLKTEQVDLAVLDANLTDGSFKPILEALHARGVPLVVCTGADVPVEIRARHPHLRMLEKPVEPTRVLAELRRLRRAQRAAA